MDEFVREGPLFIDYLSRYDKVVGSPSAPRTTYSKLEEPGSVVLSNLAGGRRFRTYMGAMDDDDRVQILCSARQRVTGHGPGWAYTDFHFQLENKSQSSAYMLDGWVQRCQHFQS
jgi:hypothetical protein